MHRTKNRRAIKAVQRTCAQQQRQLDEFQQEYNTERPHEALQQETPASQYTYSPRAYPTKLPKVEYPLHFLVKKITTAGMFRLWLEAPLLANALVDQHIGLEETDDGTGAIYFNTLVIDYLIRG